MGGSVLHDRAVPVSLSASSRPAQTGPGPAGRSGVVVRLELPDNASRDRDLRPVEDPEENEKPYPAISSNLDPARLARAVEDLIRAIDPSLDGARVEIEVTRADPAAVGNEHIAENEDDEEDTRPIGRPLRRTPADPADLGLDLAGRTLSVDGRLVTLTRREFDLLAYLQDHRGVALGRPELMNTVWRTGYLVGDRTIDVHIRRLRVKLGRHADRLSTLRGFGYRLD